MYYLSTTFFYDVLSDTQRTIWSPKIQQQSIQISSEVVEEVQQAPTYDDSQWNNSEFQQSLVSDDDVTEESWEEYDDVSGSIWQENTPLQVQNENDNAWEDDTSVDDTSPLDNTLRISNEVSIPEQDTQNTEDLVSPPEPPHTWDTDDPLLSPRSPFIPLNGDILDQEDIPLVDTVDFRSYCKDMWGIYVVIAPLKECHRDTQICSERDYIESWTCFWGIKESLWDNIEINLQDLIDAYDDMHKNSLPNIYFKQIKHESNKYKYCFSISPIFI